jgi:uncharacterized protein YjbJ (UPF0337 family)
MAGMTGMKERMAGRFMQWEGKVTGDPIRRTEGRLVAAYGRLKQAVGNMRQRRAPRPSRDATATSHDSRTQGART